MDRELLQQFDDLVYGASVAQYAEFTDATMELPAMLSVFPKSRSLPPAILPAGHFMESEKGKDVLAGLIQKLANSPLVQVVVLVSESWVVVRTPDELRKFEEIKGEVREQPDRQEALLVAYSFAGGGAMSHHKIQRGKKITLERGALMLNDESFVEGRFVGAESSDGKTKH